MAVAGLPMLDVETKAIDCARRAVSDLIQFDAYLHGGRRLPAVDCAVINVMRMRVEILGEQIDLLETRPGQRHEVLMVLSEISAACCDFLVAWTPDSLSFA